MDPQATLQRLLDSYMDANWADAKDAAEDLLGWIRGGGFPPQVHVNQEMDDRWNRALTEAACRFVILECGF